MNSREQEKREFKNVKNRENKEEKTLEKEKGGKEREGERERRKNTVSTKSESLIELNAHRLSNPQIFFGHPTNGC